MDSLASYLDSLLDDGQFDSSGHFTVSLHALHKLRTFQLTNLDLYVVRLVAAGVALGATHLEGISTKTAFDLIMRGVFVEGAQLSQLFEHLLAGSGEDGLRNLAVGLNTALGRTPPPRILVSSWTEGKKRVGVDIAQEGDQLRVKGLDGSDLPIPPGVKTGLHIRIFRRLTKGMMDSLFTGGASPERDALQGIARFCPVPLVINDQPMHERLYFRSVLAASLRVHPEIGKPVLTALDGLQKDSLVWREADSSDIPFSSAVIFSIDGPHGIYWIQNGIAVRHDDLPGLGLALVHCPHLKLDISYQNLLEDEIYQQILQRIRLDCDELTRALTHVQLPPQAQAGVAVWVNVLVSRVDEETRRPLRLWQLLRQNWRVQENPAEWIERERYLDLEGAASFRGDLLSLLLGLWHQKKPIAAFHKLGQRYLQDDPRGSLLLGGENLGPPWSILQNAELCRSLVAEFPWEKWLALPAPATCMDYLVQADLRLDSQDIEGAREFYKAAGTHYGVESTEGLLLCKLADPQGGFLGKVLQDSHTGLPGEAHELGIFTTGVRFLHEVVDGPRDWKLMVKEIQDHRLAGPERAVRYAQAARTLMLHMMVKESVLVLLIWHRDVALLSPPR